MNECTEYNKIYSLPLFCHAYLGNTFLHGSLIVQNTKLPLDNTSVNCLLYCLPTQCFFCFLPDHYLVSGISVSDMLSTLQYYLPGMVNTDFLFFDSCFASAGKVKGILNSYILLLSILFQNGTVIHKTYLSFL